MKSSRSLISSNVAVRGLVVGCVLLALYLGGGSLVQGLTRQFVDVDELQKKAKEALTEAVHAEVQITSVGVTPTLFHGVRVTLDDVAVGGKDLPAWLSAKQVHFDVGYGSLLKKEPQAHRMVISGVMLDLSQPVPIQLTTGDMASAEPADITVVFRDVQLRLPTLRKVLPVEDMWLKEMTLGWQGQSRQLNVQASGTAVSTLLKRPLHVTTRFLLPFAKSADGVWHFQDVLFRCQYHEAFIALNGDVVYNPRLPMESQVNGHLISSWLPLRDFTSLLRMFSIESPVHIDLAGQVALALNVTGSLMQPAITGHVNLSHDDVADAVTHKTLIRNLGGTIAIYSPRHLGFHQIKGTLGNAPMQLEGQVNFDTHALLLNMNTPHLSLETLQELLTTFLPQPGWFQTIQATGLVSSHVYIVGDWSDPMVQGTVRVLDTHVTSKADPTFQVQHLNGTIRAYPSWWQLKSLQGKLGNSPFSAHGLWTKAETGALFLQSHHVELHQLQTALAVSQQWTGVTVPWLARFQAEGIGDVQGSVEVSPKGSRLKGRVQLKKAALYDTQTELALEHVVGAVVFDEQSVTLSDIKGLLNDAHFSLAGVSNAVKTDIAFVMHDASVRAVLDMAALIGGVDSSGIDAHGQMDVQIQLAGEAFETAVTGTLLFKDAHIRHQQSALEVAHIQGQVAMDSSGFHTQKMTAEVAQVPITIDGFVSSSMASYEVTVKAAQMPLAHLSQGVFGMLGESQQALARVLKIEKGQVGGTLVISSSLPNHWGGALQFNDVSLRLWNALPLTVQALNYNLQTGDLSAPVNSIVLAGMPVALKGRVASATDYHLSLAMKDIPMTMVRDQARVFEALLGQALPPLNHVVGHLGLELSLTPDTQQLRLGFHNVGFSTDALPYPVYQIQGTVNLGAEKKLDASTRDLAFRYANSPINLSFDIHGLSDLYIESSGELSPLFINDVLFQNSTRWVSYATVPFEMTLSGALGDLKGKGKGNDLDVFFHVALESLLVKTATDEEGQAISKEEPVSLSSVLHLQDDVLTIEETHLRVSPESSMAFSGNVAHVFLPNERHATVSLKTDPYLDLYQLAHHYKRVWTEGLTGNIESELVLTYNAQERQQVEGFVQFDNVHSDFLDIQVLDGQLTFDKTAASLGITTLEFPGVAVSLTSAVPDVFRFPVALDEFDVQGSQFIVPLYVSWLHNVLQDRMIKRVGGQFFPGQNNGGMLPFEIQKGQVALSELILANLIVSNFQSPMRSYANAYFEFPKFRAESAGGAATGFFALNPSDNHFMTAHFDIYHMKANALTRVLLGLSNEVFGELTGEINYTTEGSTDEEILLNVQGSADFNIQNGRLPSVAKIENLLVAANTLSGGLTNLNLNSLFRLADPFKTDYFAELSGSYKIADGILYTRDTHSDGANLDLNMSGLVRMVDGHGDLLIEGKMDKEISGVLGPVGRLSVGKFLGVVPPLRKIVGHIPGLGFIPGFGGPNTSEEAEFEVRVVGPLNDPGSVQGFNWK